ncbi:MAG: ABC transporter substrate-binding protein [Elusimicrobia bacterium]|nr:ABC transporter substrate-binding protein [Elusimicrobiota bacterium]
MTRQCGWIIVASLTAVASCRAETLTVRVGYMPNVTHAQVLVGLANGAFQKALGPGVRIETRVFNAGPSIIEAFFAQAIDLGYVGPGPTINGYVRSGGKFRVIAGAARGGAGLVVRRDAGIERIEQLAGKRIATPQLGNTQDIAARAWLKGKGFRLKEQGGDVQLFPIANPDQLTLFLKKQLDAAWTVEPWVSRLIREGNGRLFFDEREIWKPITGGRYVTTHVLVDKEFFEKHQPVIAAWLDAHLEVTWWINQHQNEAEQMVNQELKRLTAKALPKEVIHEAFSRVEFTYDPVPESLFQYARWAYEQGFLGRTLPDLTALHDHQLLPERLHHSQTLKPVTNKHPTRGR